MSCNHNDKLTIAINSYPKTKISRLDTLMKDKNHANFFDNFVIMSMKKIRFKNLHQKF